METKHEKAPAAVQGDEGKTKRPDSATRYAEAQAAADALGAIVVEILRLLPPRP